MHDYLIIYRSGLFLPQFYAGVPTASKRKSGLLSQVGLIVHFLEMGAKERLDPNPLFLIDYYLSTNPDVQAVGVNPLIHYIRFGGKEGRGTHPLFDGRYYLARFAGEIDEVDTPLADFLKKGKSGLRHPSLFFDCRHYLSQAPDLKGCADNPLVHYLLVGAYSGFDPHPYFSSSFYLKNYQREIPNGMNPLEFFLNTGGYRGHDPSPRFDTSYYWEVNPDIKQAGIIPFIHYLEFGHLERRYPADVYSVWIKDQKSREPKPAEVAKEIEQLQIRPHFSIIVPVFNTDEASLRAMIESVIDQVYPYWELCIANDGSTAAHVKPILDEYESGHQFIKISHRPESGHISAASNTALSMATGDFIALLDHDDLLDRFALLENARLLSLHPQAEIIYSDEDKINQAGRRYEPFFKPDWSPELLLLQMYTGHLGVYKRDLIERIGGFREGYEGSQDFDLILRASELTNEIYHIPKVLYHWRTVEGSTAADPLAKGYAYVSGQKALQDAITRRGLRAHASRIPRRHGMYAVSYENKNSNQDEHMLSGIYSVDFKRNERSTVSLIIPSMRESGRLARLARVLRLLLPYFGYPEIEIIIVLGELERSRTSGFVADLEASVLRDDAQLLMEGASFNFSDTVTMIETAGTSLEPRLINTGVRHATGEFLCFLDDATFSIDHRVFGEPGNWLEQMIGYAGDKQVGAVGGLLIDKKNSIVISSGVTINEDGRVADLHKGEAIESAGYFGRLLGSSNCTAVRLGCLLTRRDLFEKKGGLNESLPTELADVDYGVWLRRGGYRSVMLAQFRFAQTPRQFSEMSYSCVDQTKDCERSRLSVKRRSAVLLPQYDPYYSPNLMITNGSARFYLDR